MLTEDDLKAMEARVALFQDGPNEDEVFDALTAIIDTDFPTLLAEVRSLRSDVDDCFALHW